MGWWAVNKVYAKCCQNPEPREQSNSFYLGKEEAGWERPREDWGGNNPMKGGEGIPGREDTVNIGLEARKGLVCLGGVCPVRHKP